MNLNRDLHTLEDKLQSGVVFKLQVKHFVRTAIVAYVIGFVLTFGIVSGATQRDCVSRTTVYKDGTPDNPCDWEIAPVAGPFVYSALWPVYWPLHLSYLVFR